MDKFKKLFFFKIFICISQISVANSQDASIEIHFENLPHQNKIMHHKQLKKHDLKEIKSHNQNLKHNYFNQDEKVEKSIKNLPINQSTTEVQHIISKKDLPKTDIDSTISIPKSSAPSLEIIPKTQPQVQEIEASKSNQLKQYQPNITSSSILPKKDENPKKQEGQKPDASLITQPNPILPPALPSLDNKLQNVNEFNANNNDNLLISLKFDPNINDIKEDNKNNLDIVLTKLKNNEKKIKITAYNLANNDSGTSQIVNLQRLIAIKKYLVSCSIADNRINTNIDSKAMDDSNIDKIDIFYTD